MLPVDKWHVQILDPKFGRHLHLSIIEPDYDQKEKKFKHIDELQFFDLHEADLGRGRLRCGLARARRGAAGDLGRALAVPLHHLDSCVAQLAQGECAAGVAFLTYILTHIM